MRSRANLSTLEGLEKGMLMIDTLLAALLIVSTLAVGLAARPQPTFQPVRRRPG
jgi:hypothetical protein